MPSNSPGDIPAVLRPPLPGELGWIVKAHGEHYSSQVGWGADFEGIVAGIVSRYAEQLDDPQQFCWIADLAGEPVGSVMLTRDEDRIARLRVMLVLARARGRGIGAMLGKAVLDAARACGDDTIVLWTTDRQTVARQLYQKMGFQCQRRTPNTTFDPGAIDELWRLEL